MFFLPIKQLGIAIAILVVLSIVIYYLNRRKETFVYGNSNPYGPIDYVANDNAFKTEAPLQLF